MNEFLFPSAAALVGLQKGQRMTRLDRHAEHGGVMKAKHPGPLGEPARPGSDAD